MHRGVTLVELLITVSVVALLSGIAVPAFHNVRDRVAVHGAASATASALADARHHATRWNRRTALTVDTGRALVVVRAGPDTVGITPLHALFGVTLAATRDSIAYSPGGIGFGAANTRLIVARGAAAETLTVSRAGRVRR